MLSSGEMMPDFDLPNQFGEPIALGSFRGQWLVLWWYPEAASEGCTIEGRGFHQLEREFTDLGSAIVGLSFNTVAENQNFAECEAFGFPLLSDSDWRVGHVHGVVRDPSERYANKPRRVTYLVAPDGRVARAYLVTPDQVSEHPARVLDDLRELSAELQA